MTPTLWVLVSLLFFALGEAASKLWSEGRTDWWAIAAVAAYITCEVPWLVAIREHGHLTSLGTFWSVGAVVVTILVGMVVFRESITARQGIGLALAFVACWLLS